MINITQVFVIVVLFGAGTDYCLFLIARYCEELRRRAGRGRMRSTEAIYQVGTALVASAGTVIVGLGMLYFSSFAKVKYTGPTIALSLAVALLAALTLAPAMLVAAAAARSSGPSVHPIDPPARRERLDDSGCDAADGILGQGRRPGGRLSAADPLGLPARARAPGRGRGSHEVEPQPVERPRPGSAQRDRSERRSDGISPSAS